MSFLVDGVTITCCNADCGISFQVPAWWNKGRRETHTDFYCPNGHAQAYTAESDEEKFRRERDMARQQLARAEEDSAKAHREWDKAEKEARRLKKRAAAATCPCCQRSFSNVRAHLANKHPEFVAENVV